MRRPLLTSTALALLAACSVDPSQSSFWREAGQPRAEAAFGAATLSNAQVQAGERSARASLSARFAAEVPTTVNFAFNSAALDAEALRILSAQAAFIRAFPEVRFAVYGHADQVGSDGYNYRLGLARAQAAVAFLVSQGVDRSRLEALVSEGETMPVVPSGGPERANRRAVTDVFGFVAGNASVMNGKYAEIVFRDYVESAHAPSTLEPVDPAALTTDG